MPPLEPPNGFLPGKVLFAMMLYRGNVSGPLLEGEGKAGVDPAVAQVGVSSLQTEALVIPISFLIAVSSHEQFESELGGIKRLVSTRDYLSTSSDMRLLRLQLTRWDGRRDVGQPGFLFSSIISVC